MKAFGELPGSVWLHIVKKVAQGSIRQLVQLRAVCKALKLLSQRVTPDAVRSRKPVLLSAFCYETPETFLAREPRHEWCLADAPGPGPTRQWHFVPQAELQLPSEATGDVERANGAHLRRPPRRSDGVRRLLAPAEPASAAFSRQDVGCLAVYPGLTLDDSEEGCQEDLKELELRTLAFHSIEKRPGGPVSQPLDQLPHLHCCSHENILPFSLDLDESYDMAAGPAVPFPLFGPFHGSALRVPEDDDPSISFYGLPDRNAAFTQAFARMRMDASLLQCTVDGFLRWMVDGRSFRYVAAASRISMHEKLLLLKLAAEEEPQWFRQLPLRAAARGVARLQSHRL